MKNYNRFIVESYKFLDNVYEDCAPIIKELRECKETYENICFDPNTGHEKGYDCGKNRLIYHTDNTYRNISHYHIINHMERDFPTDTPLYIHEYISELFDKKLGWNPRCDAIFTHNSQLQIQIDTGSFVYDNNNFGKKYILLPIGEYKYAYSETVGDLFDVLWHKFPFVKENQHKQRTLEYIKDLIKSRVNAAVDGDDDTVLNELYDIKEFVESYVDNIKTDDLCTWLSKSTELMLRAEKYYLINMDYEDEIKNYIWG